VTLLCPYGVDIAAAQTDNRIVTNPPMLEIQQGTLPKSTLLAQPAAPRMTGKKTLDLNIVYTESSIYNPATGRADKVKLRSYTGANMDPRAPYVAPTIEVNPGDTVDYPAQQAAAGPQLCRDRYGPGYAALLQRDQSALAWPVGQPDRQQ
jgi:hypothetical protein